MNLLEKLVEALQEERRIPLKHSLLIVSGIEDRRTGNKYLEKFDEIYKQYDFLLKEKGLFYSDKLKKAEILSEYLTMPVRYNKHKFLFHQVIDARLSKNPFCKHGNCIGLTSLYNALAQKENIYTGVYKQRSHIFSRVIISNREYAVENTYKGGFNVKIKGHYGKNSNNELLASILVSRNFKNIKDKMRSLELAKKISPRTSLIYLNIAICEYELGRYSLALEEINKAIQIDSKDFRKYEIRSRVKNKLKDYKGSKEDRKKYKKLRKK